MKTYKLKSVARRVSMFGSAFVVAIAAFTPFLSSATYADALNPLTDRSLTLSSSAPGWDFKDGSGNDTYAQPNSGANGKKTGNTFSFKVSTDSSADTGNSTPVMSFGFQYCTQPAGTCTAPGNDTTTGTTRGDDDVANKKSDLNIVSNTAPVEMDNTGDAFFTTTGANQGNVNTVPNRDGSQGNYIVMTKDKDATSWTQSTGWEMTSTNNEDLQQVGDTPNVTGKPNYIKLTATGTGAAGLSLHTGGQVKVIFFGTDDNYITNPGKGAFFVKINDYSSATTMNSSTLVDGGVTVANVMNQGIEIQTKVLETMDFSVGTVDPDTLQTLPDDNGASPGGADTTSQLAVASGGARLTHGVCDPILNSMDPGTDQANTLLLGDELGEHSLSTAHTYSTHSYFRLSSNASAGATVYYSGVTLSNTVNDKIAPIGATKAAPSPGTEQFGLALDNGTAPGYQVDYNTERASGKVYESGADNAAQGLVDLNNGVAGATGVDATLATDWTAAGITSGKAPQLQVNSDGTSLTPDTNYNQGTGIVNGGSEGYGTINTAFAFDATSNQIPVPFASESSHVVDCATGKVRYIANIAATTPAGIYTTKINYIAAPQY